MTRLRVALALSLLLGPLGRDLSFAATFYVNASRPDDSGDGLTPATAKRNITAAITLANGNGVADTINVAAGTYSDSDCSGCGGTQTETFPLSIAVSGTSLVGAGAATTFLRANQDSQAAVLYGYDFFPSAPAVTLEGFTITNTGGYGVQVQIPFNAMTVDSRLTITRNIIRDNFRSGLRILGTFAGTVSPAISSNTITRNGAAGAGFPYAEFGVTISAAAVASTCSPSFTNNLISENGGTSFATGGGVSVAAIAASAAAPVFTGNTIRNNANWGVSIAPFAAPSFVRNTILDNDDDDFNGTGYEGAAADLYNDAGATLFAFNNWWKTTPPNVDTGSPVHVDNQDGGASDITIANPSLTQTLTYSVSPSSGPVTGGTVLTITASSTTFFVDNVGQASSRIAVTVGGASASSLSLDPSGTVLTATVPSGSVGPANVTVTNPAGQTGTLAGGYTYVLPSGLQDSGPAAYPNPWRPDSGLPLTIHSLPAGATVRVYTFNGELIRQMTADSAGAASWDVKNDSGETVVSGVYFVFIEGDGVKKKMKVVVQR